jgi:hypothetical protein
MKTKLFLAIVAAATLPVAGIAAEASASDHSSQDAEINKLLTEMNSAPADQKIGAIVTLLNKLVEERKAAKEKGMCMCCTMMKSDQSDQKSDQSEHHH